MLDKSCHVLMCMYCKKLWHGYRYAFETVSDDFSGFLDVVDLPDVLGSKPCSKDEAYLH